MPPVQISTPRGFDFQRTVRSHGWFDLPPFRYDEKARTLDLAFCSGAGVIAARLRRKSSRAITAELTFPPVSAGVRRAAAREAVATIGSILRLDEDLAALGPALRKAPHLLRSVAEGGGRLLRAPTVFEDTVKMMCTVNCSWSLTRLMVGRLVDSAGAPGPGGVRAFPTPEALAAQPVAFFRDVIRAGYRAPYLKELVDRVAAGALDLESLRDPNVASEVARQRLRSIKGVGDYAADNLLRLLGHHDRLGIDSWCRASYRRLYPRTAKGDKLLDAAMHRRYRPFAPYQGLAMWLDLTRHWHKPEAGDWP
ncbi:MAG TPA: Fe-S cluster assembly protein HesB [Polyangia bacterium]|jgi:N-glycosylase/DNA lyase|nr:Fe-S cluster assembly protein HesB [Polyangia bacterium]